MQVRVRTYSLLECGATNPLLLLALHWVIKQDTGAENVDLPLAKPGLPGEECAAGVPKRIGQAEAENETAENGECTHNHKKPKPTGLTTDATHVQDAVGKELR